MKPRTLVVCITHPEAEPILRMNWPWIKRSGAHTMVVHHEGKRVAWHPQDCTYLETIGTDPDAEPWRWIGRLLRIMKLISNAHQHEAYVFCESDTIFLRELPDNIETGGTLAGFKSEGFHSSRYFHCPWTFTRSDLSDFISRSERLLGLGFGERGFIDRFIGLYEDIFGPIIQSHPNYSRNTVDMGDIQAIRASKAAWAVHGVKTAECLAAITEGLT